MMDVIPLAVLVLVWVFMDPPQRYDSPYTRDHEGREIDYYTEKLIALSPKIELSEAMIERLMAPHSINWPGQSAPSRGRTGHYIALFRLGEGQVMWCQDELGYAPTIAHDRHRTNFILFNNDDDAMHFFMRWL